MAESKETFGTTKSQQSTPSDTRIQVTKEQTTNVTTSVARYTTVKESNQAITTTDEDTKVSTDADTTAMSSSACAGFIFNQLCNIMYRSPIRITSVGKLLRIIQ